MRSFLLGVIVGALGFWAYQRLMGEMGEPEMMGAGMGGVTRPSQQEVHGRPHEPLPAHAPPEAEAEHPRRRSHAT